VLQSFFIIIFLPTFFSPHNKKKERMEEIQPLCDCRESDAQGDCKRCHFGMDDTGDAETNEKVIRLLILELRKHARALFDEGRKMPRECEGVWVCSYDSLFDAMHGVMLGFVPAQALLMHQNTDEVRQCLLNYKREREIVVWIRLFEYRHVAKQVKKRTTETLHEDEDVCITVDEDDGDEDDEMKEPKGFVPLVDAPEDAPREDAELDEDLDALEAIERHCYERAMVFNIAKLTE